MAEYRNAKSLMDGIHWVLCQADHHSLSTAAVRKVAANFSQDSVALRYIEVYNHAMAFKHYGI